MSEPTKHNVLKKPFLSRNASRVTSSSFQIVKPLQDCQSRLRRTLSKKKDFAKQPITVKAVERRQKLTQSPYLCKKYSTKKISVENTNPTIPKTEKISLKNSKEEIKCTMPNCSTIKRYNKTFSILEFEKKNSTEMKSQGSTQMCTKIEGRQSHFKQDKNYSRVFQEIYQRTKCLLEAQRRLIARERKNHKNKVGRLESQLSLMRSSMCDQCIRN